MTNKSAIVNCSLAEGIVGTALPKYTTYVNTRLPLALRQGFESPQTLITDFSLQQTLNPPTAPDGIDVWVADPTNDGVAPFYPGNVRIYYNVQPTQGATSPPPVVLVFKVEYMGVGLDGAVEYRSDTITPPTSVTNPVKSLLSQSTSAINTDLPVGACVTKITCQATTTASEGAVSLAIYGQVYCMDEVVASPADQKLVVML